jgi:hypothetical protein
MRQSPKITVLALLLIGLCCMAFAYMVEMLSLVNLAIDIQDQRPEFILDSIQKTRKFTAMIYLFGVLWISVGAICMLRMPLAIEGKKTA